MHVDFDLMRNFYIYFLFEHVTLKVFIYCIHIDHFQAKSYPDMRCLERAEEAVRRARGECRGDRGPFLKKS